MEGRAVIAGGTAWSLSERALLRMLWADGLSSTQIGLRIGRTKSSVLGQVHRMMLPARPSPLPEGSPTRNRNRNHDKIRAPAATLAPLASLAGAGTIHIPTRSFAPRVTPSKRPAATPEPKPVVARKGPQRTCEWLEGSDRRTWVRCSETAEPGKPYCKRHCDIAYIKRPPPKQEAA